MENPGFLDYRIPLASDLPMIETIVIEVPNKAHPYGVRGVGESGIIPPLVVGGRWPGHRKKSRGAPLLASTHSESDYG